MESATATTIAREALQHNCYYGAAIVILLSIWYQCLHLATFMWVVGVYHNSDKMQMHFALEISTEGSIPPREQGMELLLYAGNVHRELRIPITT